MSISVNIKNLRIARKNAGYTSRESTDKICSKNTQVNRVEEWEKGETYPTWKQLEKLAKQYGVNVFMLTNNEEIKDNRKIHDYRKKEFGGKLELNTKKYINFLLQRQKYLENILKEDGTQKNRLVGCGAKVKKPEELAKNISEIIGYDINQEKEESYLKYLILLMEQKGVFIMKTLSYWSISVSNMRGVYLKNDYAPVIALNRKDSKTAQLFTLAHEIAHLFINKEGVSNIDFRDGKINETETFCNKVASHLLLPEDIFKKDKYELKDVEEIARKYQVSELFVFYRLKGLNKISGKQSKMEDRIIFNMNENINNQKNKKNKNNKKQTGSSINNMRDSNGSLFNNFISSLYFENKINAFEASKILKMSIERV